MDKLHIKMDFYMISVSIKMYAVVNIQTVAIILHLIVILCNFVSPLQDKPDKTLLIPKSKKSAKSPYKPR